MGPIPDITSKSLQKHKFQLSYQFQNPSSIDTNLNEKSKFKGSIELIQESMGVKQNSKGGNMDLSSPLISQTLNFAKKTT